MKTRLFLISIVLSVFIHAKATDIEKYCYVVTNHDTFFCKNVRIGWLSNFVCKFSDGSVKKVKKEEVNAYFVNGDLFVKKPLYVNGIYAHKTTFMQMVAKRGDMFLYKVSLSPEDLTNSSNQVIYVDKDGQCYMVFNGNKFVVNLTDVNAPTVLDFFAMKL